MTRNPKGKRANIFRLRQHAKSVYLTQDQYIQMVHKTVVEPLIDTSDVFRRLAGALRARDIPAMLSITDAMVKQQYETAATHFAAHQVASLIRKYPFTHSSLDPEEVAKATFLRGERKCRRVNQKIRAWVGDSSPLRKPRSKPRPHWHAVKYMQRWIRSVIGEFNPELVIEACDHSGGASIGVHGNATNIFQKFQGDDWSVSLNALQYVAPAMWRNATARDIVLPSHPTRDGPYRYKCYDKIAFGEIVRSRASIVDYNKLDFVLKTAKTYRTIAVEPLLNGFLQKGVDKFFRTCLRKVGIDLSQQSLNSVLAQRGSLDWETADPWVTIDLENASGSISEQLVRLLLPRSWFNYLDSIRSPYYKLGDQVDRYESFVSMGNGFCFPLESLIFAAFAKAASQDEDFTVYGDDLICRRSVALYLIELLAYFGFKTNVEKSFIVGPFRESCGTDWYSGEDVRPCVVDKAVDSMSRVFAVHNSTLRNPKSTVFLSEFRSGLRNRVPSKVRYVGLKTRDFFSKKDPLSGKLHVPDSYLAMPLDACMSSPTFKWDRDMQAWKWLAWQARPVHDPDAIDATSDVDMYAVLRGATPFEGSPKYENTGRPQHLLRYSATYSPKWSYGPQVV